MRLAAYVILMASLAIVFYFLGMPAPLMQLFSSQGATTMEAQCDGNQSNCENIGIINRLASAMLPSGDAILASLLAIALVGVAASLMGGFSAIYLVPMLMLAAIVNYLCIPISYIIQGLPGEIRVPVMVLSNVLLILAVLGFVRGGN